MAVALPDVLTPPDIAIDIVERGLELMPIPAAQVRLANDILLLSATNRAFRQAGLGAAWAASPMLQALDDRLRGFLASADLRQEFAWQHGDAIDCRHYAVTLARSSSALRQTCQAH